jgi:hypothetical protein
MSTRDGRYVKFKGSIENMLRDGQMPINQIYEKIKVAYGDDCDDTERCEHAGIFYQYGEWKHLVRDALQALKRQGIVTYDSASRTWMGL